MTQVTITNRDTNETITFNPANLEGVATKSYKFWKGFAAHCGAHVGSRDLICRLDESQTLPSNKFKAVKVLVNKSNQN